MAAPNDPQAAAPQGGPGAPATTAPSETGIQAPPPPGTPSAVQTAPAPASIPLPPPKRKAKPVDPARLAAFLGRLDLLLVLAALVLTFFVASFASRNTDLFMHLATGRELLHGNAWGGNDPFSYTTGNVYWANHNWLVDIAAYGLYQLDPSGALLVILKAALVTLLAVVMLAIRRPGQSLWIPVVCTALAVVAMSPRLLLQPTVLSFVLLGVTLWQLQKPGKPGEPARGRRGPPSVSWRHLWVLPALFVLWVNVDSWFVLGPLTVGLVWLGEFLQESFLPVRSGPDAADSGRSRTLGLVFLAGLAACLINPHHVYAFGLPAQLGLTGAGPVLETDTQFRPLFLSPWNFDDYFGSTARRGLGYSVAGTLYFPLVLLGAVSFLVNLGGLRVWRLLVWLAYLGLSAYLARAIPFFAVVTGPIAALNFQDALAARYGTAVRVERNWRQWSIGGRILTLVCGLVLIALAWPGWLHVPFGQFDDPRWRVTYRVEVEPSLKQTALQLKAWREAGVLRPEDHGFSMMPDVANYCAYFCPEEKGFFDHRFELFGDAAQTYVDLRQGLEFGEKGQEWPRAFRRHGINHVMLYLEKVRTAKSMLVMVNDPPDPKLPKQWDLVYMDGRCAIFAWTDPEKPGQASPLAAHRFDPDRAAFGANTRPAPAERSPDLPSPDYFADLWSSYARGRGMRPLDADQAGMCLLYFDYMAVQYRNKALLSYLAASTAQTLGSPQLASGGIFHLFRTLIAYEIAFVAKFGQQLPPQHAVVQQLMQAHILLQEDGPTSAAVLAVRACRRALAENPEHAQGYTALYLAYQTLQQRSKERGWARRTLLLPLASVRQVQRIAALRHAAELDPENEFVHTEMAKYFLEMKYLDLAKKHMELQLKLVRKNGPNAAEDAADFAKRLEGLEKRYEQLDKVVARAQNEYEIGKDTYKTIKDKARYALEKKQLAGQALDLMLQSDEVAFDPEAIRLELQLLLSTGRTEEAREGLGGDLEGKLGYIQGGEYAMPAYEWLQFLLAAATGDYLEADRTLEPVIALREKVVLREKDERVKGTLSRLMSLDFAMPPYILQSLWWSRERMFLIEIMRASLAARPQRAEINVLRGVLAVEAGDIPRAERLFREARSQDDGTLKPIIDFYVEMFEANR